MNEQPFDPIDPIKVLMLEIPNSAGEITEAACKQFAAALEAAKASQADQTLLRWMRLPFLH